MINGHTKGRNGENAVCYALSAWWTGIDHKDKAVYELPFRRRTTSIVPLAGHWNGAGDILTRQDITFPFCVEVKRVEGWTLEQCLEGKGKLPVFWDQTLREAAKSKLFPLMVFKKNHSPWLVATLIRGRYFSASPYVRIPWPQGTGNHGVSIVRLSDFVKLSPHEASKIETQTGVASRV